MDKEHIFVKGMFFEKPNKNAPEWVRGRISIKVKDFAAFAEEYTNKRGYLNIDLKKSESGKYYFELNTYEPKKADFDNGMEPPVQEVSSIDEV